jgi:glycosyltransferase involved in cell wall biosynthesis
LICPEQRNLADLISVIVTTYNRPDALDAVLRSLAEQTDSDFEVIVADDGSTAPTKAVLAGWNGRVGRRLVHVWHSHQDFRGGEIRNRGIRSSAGSYCIFLDGDCLTRADFVAAHRRLAEPGWFVAGNRILLSRDFTDRILADGRRAENSGLAALAGEKLRGHLNQLRPALRLPLGPLRKLRRHRWDGAKTCNLAVARSDLDRVDGFDNSYTGWGLEDSDLMVRLLHAGVGRKDGRFATGVFHLWHPDADRAGLAENRRRLDNVLASDRIRAERGLSTIPPSRNGI